jgi:Phosphotransferase enzyme family
MSAALPTEPAHLSNEWLTEVLCTARTGGPAAVVSHTWEQLAQQGAAGVVGRVALTYDREASSSPESVVIKFATPYAPIRALMLQFGLYRSEVEFYRQLGATAGIPVPHCYFADLDLSTGFFVLVLEDMKESRLMDFLNPSVSDIEHAIDHLAPFHAQWWNSPRLRELDWLPYPEGPQFDARLAGMKQAYASATAAARQKFGAAFPPVLSTACDRILGEWDNFIRSRLSGPLTLTHRDFHPAQLFFPSDRGGRFAVFDWQTIAIACGADDLARIVAMGLTTADRAAHDHRLIGRYHAALVAAGVIDYSLAQCADDFRLGLTSSLSTNVVAAAAIDPSLFERIEAETGINVAYALFGRLAAAFEAHDVIDLLPGGQWT